MQSKVNNNRLSTRRSVILHYYNLGHRCAAELLDKQRFWLVLSGITWRKLRKKVEWNIDVVMVDHGRSWLKIVEQLVNGFEETMK